MTHHGKKYRQAKEKIAPGKSAVLSLRGCKKVKELSLCSF